MLNISYNCYSFQANTNRRFQSHTRSRCWYQRSRYSVWSTGHVLCSCNYIPHHSTDSRASTHLVSTHETEPLLSYVASFKAVAYQLCCLFHVSHELYTNRLLGVVALEANDTGLIPDRITQIISKW